MQQPAAAATTLSSLQQQQNQLKKQQEENAAKLKSLKSDKEKKQEYKDTLDAQVQTVQNQINVLNKQISAYDNDILEREKQISAKQAAITENTQKLKERLHALYLTGEASSLEIVLNAKNIVDLADKTEALRAITAHDTALINALKSDMAAVKTEKETIEANREKVAASKVSLDAKRKEISSLVTETNKVIAEINSDVADAQKQKTELAAQSEKLDAAVDQWYKNYYAEQAKKKASGGTSGSGSTSTGGSGGYVSKGNFTWPVPGVYTMSRGFGDTSMGSFHKGIDIAGSGIYGKAIVAADSGRVIMAGWGNYGTGYGGYGNVVAIDHGGGYSTLYGHCSSVAVSTGQLVTKGQVIAYVGSTGQSTGPHLHFEVRVNGVAKNPMNWFG
ncbi:MAG: peptidoglycan DD-metalloendopeptidase family protein [Clostridiales bacterium]|nr:peptidoglycan DD-metalloendopeptidase family protein [Clostridiales bacterium]